MTSLYRKISENYEQLSEAEQEVIDFILKYKEIEQLRLKDIKDQLYISNATIIRACKKLNFSTFNELKYAFIKVREENTREIQTETEFKTLTEGIKKDTLMTLELVDEQQIEQVCTCLMEARRIFCVGMGSSTEVASEFNRKLKLSDLWSNKYTDKFSIERIPSIITPKDVIVIFSLSGEVEEINTVMVQAKSQGATIISITNMSMNKLKSISTHSLLVYSSPSNRKKVRSRLMLYVMSTLIYEKLVTKIPSLE